MSDAVMIAPPWLLDAMQERARKVAKPFVPPAGSGHGTTAWGKAALEGIVAELSAAVKGTRDDTRNAACYRLGGIVAGGNLSRDEAVAGALRGCESNGLLAEEGQEKILKQIERGLDDGAREPKGPDPATRPVPVRTREEEEVREEAFKKNGHAEPPPIIKPPKTPDFMPDEVPDDEHLTDIGNGKRLVRLYGHDLKRVPGWDWTIWDGTRWARDLCDKIEHMSQESVLAMYEEIPTLPDPADRERLAKHAKVSEKAGHVRGAVDMAKSNPAVGAWASDFDSFPFLLNTRNGVVNLRTGELRPHTRSDMMTHKAPVSFDPSAACPVWEEFLKRIYGDDKDLVSFVQRAVGYTLTGSTKEQCLFLLYGVGSNGKSTLLKTVAKMLGDGYSRNAAIATFLASRNPGQYGPRPDLARLAGARYVVSVEPDDGARFSETTIKSLTGGDDITAAYKYDDDFTFTPCLKLWISANHKPAIRDTSHAMWRRIRLVPHKVKIEDEDQDKGLDGKLEAELPGILNWAIRGCLEWQVFGLPTPEVVRVATKEYKDEQDVIGRFIEECTEKIIGRVKSADLYEAYVSWAKKSGEYEASQTRFGKALTEAGIERKKDGVYYYTGFDLTKDAKKAYTISGRLDSRMH